MCSSDYLESWFILKSLTRSSWRAGQSLVDSRGEGLYSSLFPFGSIYLDKILTNLSGSNIPSIPCPYSPLWATTPPAGQLWKVHVQKNGRILGLYSVKPRYLHYASSVYGPRIRIPMAQHIYLAIPGIYYKIHYTFLLLGCFNNWHSPKERRDCLFVCFVLILVLRGRCHLPISLV